MRSLFFVFLFLVSFTVTAQSNSFLVSGGKLVWENVYINSQPNIPAMIARHVRLEITSSQGNTVFKGRGANIINSCPETSSFMKDDISFDFEIEVNDGKYRVTVSNFVFKANNKNNVKAENYFIKNNEILTSGTLLTDLECFESYLNKIFNPTLYKNKS